VCRMHHSACMEGFMKAACLNAPHKLQHADAHRRIISAISAYFETGRGMCTHVFLDATLELRTVCASIRSRSRAAYCTYACIFVHYYRCLEAVAIGFFRIAKILSEPCAVSLAKRYLPYHLEWHMLPNIHSHALCAQ
jgi:hypothetical protein